MKRRYLAAIFAMLLLSLLTFQKGTSVEQASSLPGDPKEGRKLFERKGCLLCHAIRGEGGTEGSDLRVTLKLQRSLTQIAGIMWNHAPAMKEVMEKRGIPRPTFNGDEMADLVSFLKSNQHLDEPGNLSNGHQLFYSKGCFICHAIRGEGGKVGPDLGKFERLASPILLVQIMWNHAPQMEVLMEKKAMPWPIFKDKEMADLLAYIKSKGRAGAKR